MAVPVPCSISSASSPPGWSTDELHRTLNMGIGMVVVCAPTDVDTVQAAIGEPTRVIGELVAHDDNSSRVVFV